jgi:hypothetical protein
MHLVGYLYEDYHDARSFERKVRNNIWVKYLKWWEVTKYHIKELKKCASFTSYC